MTYIHRTLSQVWDEKIPSKIVFKTWRIYKAVVEHERAWLKEYDFTQSFTGQFLRAGFETFGFGFDEKPPKIFAYKKRIAPTINWHGTSLHEPDTLFIKGDMFMIMSLQGTQTPYNKDYESLFNNKAVKYIILKKGKDILWQDWTGNLPPKEITNIFVN